jgi:hypothetical protein
MVKRPDLEPGGDKKADKRQIKDVFYTIQHPHLPGGIWPTPRSRIFYSDSVYSV